MMLPCGVAKAFHVAQELTVDCLRRLAADAAGVPTGSGDRRGAVAAGLLLLRCDGRLLRDGEVTLAEAGVTDGSRIEVLRVLQGGGALSSKAAASHGEPSEFRSLTRSNLMGLIGKAEALLRRGGYSGTVTSHAVQSLFQNAKPKDEGGKVVEAYRNVVSATFHPQDRWGQSYSSKIPTFVVTYTWSTDLVNDLPLFLDEAEKMLRLTDKEKERATWWLDIWFNDQNRKPGEMHDVLGEARLGFQDAHFHVVFLLNGIFKRCWCLAELLYRMQVLPLTAGCCVLLAVNPCLFFTSASQNMSWKTPNDF